MGLNFCSAVGVVVVNKSLFRQAEGLRFATLLTGLHFLATALGERACHMVGQYELKPLKQAQVSFIWLPPRYSSTPECGWTAPVP